MRYPFGFKCSQTYRWKNGSVSCIIKLIRCKNMNIALLYKCKDGVKFREGRRSLKHW